MRRSNFFIHGRTPKDVWHRGLKLIMNQGVHILDERGSDTKEILNLMTRIEEPMGEFPDEIRERMLFEYGNSFLSPENNGFPYTYGERLRNWHGASRGEDQIKSIIDRLNNNINTRRATATTWIPTIDGKKEEVPCMVMVDFKLREKLELTAVFRSHDFYGAYPYNIYALSKLQKYVSDEIVAVSGGITVFSISAHIYAGDFQDVC